MYDMHSHTSFSDDCSVPMEDMLEAACRAGLEGLAVTDHYDPGYPDPEFPFLIDFRNYHAALDRMADEYRGRLDVIKGLEIGLMDTQLAESSKVVNAYPYDFIIGSFHCLRQEDIYKLDYSRRDRKALLKDFYEYMYECFDAFDDYDIIGHYTIIDRYIGGIFSLDPYMEIIRETLKMIIEKGKGLEINTSCFKYDMPVWLPRDEILEAYRELGGEILTIGSDSHETSRFADHFDEAAEFARAKGFTHYCTFRNRKPAFHSLGK